MVSRVFSGEHGIRRSSVVAWIVYDVGNTLFYTGVVGIFFPLWITQKMAGDDATVGYTLAAAMAIALVVGPVIGAFSDQVGRRMPFLAVSTFTCIAATLLLGGDNLTLALSLFAVAVIAITTSTIFYNTLLADVSTEATRGTVGGLGVGIGYLGAIIAVALALIFVESRGQVFGFRVVGVLYLLAAIPLLLLLKERPRPPQTLTASRRVGRTVAQLKATLGNIQRFPGLLRFLVARFWYIWTVNTSASFAILYGTGTVGFEERHVEVVLLVGVFVAIPSGLLWGIVVDRVGPNRALSVVLVGWVFMLVMAALIPWLDLPSYLWWGIAVSAGVLVAGVWVADRPYMLRLTSPQYMGEFFGLHGMTGRLSFMVGPFMWGFISVTLGLGQRAAVLSLAVTALIGLILIQGVGDRAQTPVEDPVL